MGNDDEDEFTELFEFEYTGEVRDLKNALQDVPGVNEVGSFSERLHRQVDTDLTVKIAYNPISIDRTSICIWAEENIDGVSNAVSA